MRGFQKSLLTLQAEQGSWAASKVNEYETFREI